MRTLLVWACIATVGCGGELAVEESSASLGAYTATRYPIVLIHGFLGFETLFGAIDYFNGIPEALREGGATVFVVHASQASDSITRGAQLIPQLEEIKRTSGAAKLNLIGHSQGAMDARLIAAERPDLVASVTSVAGPHRGAPAAEALLDAPLGFGTGGVQVLSDLFKLLAGSPDANDAKAALMALSPAGAAAFNARYPAALPATECGSGAAMVNGIRYYSWGGVAGLTNPADLIDPTYVLLGPLGGLENDGLVPRCSNHLGVVIRDNYLSNHTDQTNLLFGLISPFGPNPKALYRAHANRLKSAAL